MFIWFLVFAMLNGVFGNSLFLVSDFAICNGQYVAYTNEAYNLSLNDVVVAKNGCGEVYKTSLNNYGAVLRGVDKIAVEKVVLQGETFAEIKEKLGLKILEKIMVSDSITLYNCYTNKYKKSVDTECGKMNIQVAICANCVCVGYPFLIDYWLDV